MDKSSLAFYVDGEKKSIDPVSPNSLSPGQIGEYIITGFSAATDGVVRVTSGGLESSFEIRKIHNSCKEIKDSGDSTGDSVYKIKTTDSIFNVYCDMTNDGG